MMKGLMAVVCLMVVAVMAIVTMPGCDTAFAAAVSPAKISPQRNTTIYFGDHTTATGKVVDTLVWSSDRNFNDTANYYCAAFATGVNTTGYLTVSILNDSSIIVTSSAAGDSLKKYFYQVLLKKK
jgi:hypothetical protein